jgi:hypothetical protein
MAVTGRVDRGARVHLSHCPPVDAAAQTVGTVLHVAVPAVALVLSGRLGER